MRLDDELTIRLARPDDVDTLAEIEEEAAAWQRSRGIEPGQPPRPFRDIFAATVAAGQTYVTERGGVVAGKITLQAADSLWYDQPGESLYIHGLTVRRAFAGQEIGRMLLRWADDKARVRGKTYLRLDCNANNPALRAYYEHAGFAHRGDVVLAHRVASRYEKGLSPSREGEWNPSPSPSPAMGGEPEE
jgi:ribosomal protein S18 acetylase RimI-like enzyme